MPVLRAGYLLSISLERPNTAPEGRALGTAPGPGFLHMALQHLLAIVGGDDPLPPVSVENISTKTLLLTFRPATLCRLSKGCLTVSLE